MATKTIGDIEVGAQRVLMRVDFNVPLADGVISDDRRIRAAVESIHSVIDRGGRLILISHLGRPKGEGPEPAFSLRPCARRLSELIDRPVQFADDCIGPGAKAAAGKLRDGDVLLLENLRFHKAEKKGDADFAAQLAALGDIYCNDAFGAAHRDDASMVAVPRAMVSKPKVAGFLMRKEIQYLADTFASPQRPFVAVLGGAKVSDKIGAITNLLDQVDAILVGGAMAYTLMLAAGKGVGDSLVEPDRVDDAGRILAAAEKSPADLMLPADHVGGRTLASDTPVQTFVDQIEPGWLGLDIGPASVAAYQAVIGQAKTIVWNGPMGAFETPPFDAGTRAVAQAIAQATQAQAATSIIGGGDSAAAVEQFGLADKVSHVSTGGGASLEMLEGKSFNSVKLLDVA